jgi:hypothetical protein
MHHKRRYINQKYIYIIIKMRINIQNYYKRILIIFCKVHRQNSIIFLIYHTVQKPLLLACHSGNQTNNTGRCHPTKYTVYGVSKKT